MDAIKSLDGLTVGAFDEVFVSDNVQINGNLTVNGSITGGGGGGGGSTDDFFAATDTTNQFRASSATVDFVSTTTTSPTFRFRNNTNSTGSTTIDVGQVQTGLVTCSGISALTINSTTTTSGTLNGTTVNVTGTTTTGACSVANATTTGTLSTTGDGQSTSVSTGAIVTPGGLGVAKNTHVGGQLHCTATTPSTSTTTGCARFSGGIGVAGNGYFGGQTFSTAATYVDNPTANDLSIMYLRNDTGTGNGVIFKNGSTRISDGGPNSMTIRNDAGRLQLFDNTGTGFVLSGGTITSPSSLSTFSLTTSSGITGASVTSSGNTGVGGNLTVGGTTTLNDPLTQNDPLDADDSTSGSIFTFGGLKVVKRTYAQGGIVVPYGQSISANTAFGNKARMMQADFSLAGGLTGDALYLYTPGSSAQAGTSFVLGVNTDMCRLPQTTQATSTTTGALQVAGGVGIVGNLHVGGSITGGSVSYSSTSSGTFAVTNGTGTTLTVASTTATTSPTTGAVTVAGGVGIAGDLNVGGTITGGAISYGSTSTGTLNVTNGTGATLNVASTQDNTTVGDGAVVIQGGLSVGRNMSIARDLRVGVASPINGIRYITMGNSSTNAAAGISLLMDTAAAGSPAELIVLGPNHATNPNDMILRNPAGNVLLYGSGNAGFYVGATTTFSQLPFIAQSTTDSTSPTTGSITTSGGLGVSRSIRVGNNITAGDTASNGSNTITVSNQSTGTSALAGLTLDTQAVGNGNIFLNGPNRTVDGGANTMTVRNDAGNLRLQNTTGSTILFNGTLIETSRMEVTDTTPSTSVTTGSFVADGGVGIAGSTHIGGQLHCTATTASTSPTTGCARFSGGIGVAGDINVGGNVNVTGTITGGSVSYGSISSGTFAVTNGTGTTLTVASTTASTSPTTGAVTVAGGIGVAGSINAAGEVSVDNNGKAEMRVYNGGANTEWVFGQRSGSDHDFTITSKVSNTFSEKMRLNTAGELKLGNGAFFGYAEGTFLPTFGAFGGSPTVVYTTRVGKFVRVGKQVTCTIALSLEYVSGGGTILLTDLIPYGTPEMNPVINISPSPSLIPSFGKPYFAMVHQPYGGYVVSNYSYAWAPCDPSGSVFSIYATYTYNAQ